MFMLRFALLLLQKILRQVVSAKIFALFVLQSRNRLQSKLQ